MNDWSTDLARRDAPNAPIVLAHQLPFRLGALQVEPARRLVSTDDGSDEVVQQRTMQVLVCLARSEGRILAREDLIASCWAGRNVSDDAINRVISQLRRLAEGIGARSFVIETITRVGYRLVVAPIAAQPLAMTDVGRAEVAVVAAAQTVIAGKTETARATYGSIRSFDRRALLFGGVVAAVVVALLIFLAGESIRWWAPASVADEGVSIRIANFTALDVASQGAAQAMREELRTALLNSAIDVDDRANLSITGVVRRVGAQLRVTTRLDDVAQGQTLWSGARELPANNQVALTEAMQELHEVIGCGLNATHSQSPKLSQTQKSLYFIYCANEYFDSGIERPLAALRTLTRSAPDFAPGWLGIANMAGFSGKDDPAFNAEGLAAARQVVALAPDKADGYTMEAVLLPVSQAREREALLRRASPLDAIECRCARDFLGDFLIQTGRFKDALATYRLAQGDHAGGKSDGPAGLWRLGLASELMGDRPAADAFFKREEADFGPDTVGRWQRPMWRGGYASLDTPTSPKPSDPAITPLWHEAMAALTTRDAAASKRIAAKLRAVSVRGRHQFVIADLLAQLHDLDGAFASLNQSFLTNGPFAGPGRYPGIAEPLLWDPTLSPLWRDARFASFLQRSGFIAYWRETRSRPDICSRPAPPEFCQLI